MPLKQKMNFVILDLRRGFSQVLSSTWAGNTMPVLNLEKSTMGRAHDMGFIRVQEPARFEIQRAADMGTGIQININLLSLANHQKPAASVRRFSDEPV